MTEPNENPTKATNNLTSNTLNIIKTIEIPYTVLKVHDYTIFIEICILYLISANQRNWTSRIFYLPVVFQGKFTLKILIL